jgi:hypothetical protein
VSRGTLRVLSFQELSAAPTLRDMAVSGAQAIPGVTLHEAYRFETDDGRVDGIVFKSIPRLVWEAHIIGTSIMVKGETRREAVEQAIAEARKDA